MNSKRHLIMALRSYLLPAFILLGILGSNFFSEMELFSNWFRVGEIVIPVEVSESQNASKFDVGSEEQAAPIAEEDSATFALSSSDTANSGNIRDAYAAMEVGKFAEAETIFRSEIDLNRSNVNSWNGLGVAQVRLGKLKEASTSFQEALKLEPHFVRAKFNLALLYSLQGDTAKALAGYLEVLRKQPGNSEALYNLGVLLLRKGLLDSAENHFLAVVATNHSARFATAWYNLGLIAQKKGDLTLALERYGKAIRLKPDLVRAWYNMAIAQQKLTHLDSAQLLFTRVIKLDPRHLRSYYNLAMIAQKNGKADSASFYLQKCTELDPSYSKAYLSLALTELRQGNPREAMRHAKSMLQKDPKSTAARLVLGQAYLEMEDYPNAMKAYREALEIDPNYIEAHLNMGVLFLRKNDLAQAKEQFLLALEKRSDYWEARYNLGLTMFKQGNLEEAKLEFRKVLQAQPNNVSALYNSGLLALQIRDLSQASQMFKQVLQIDSTHHQSWFNLGRIASLQEKDADAENFYAKALLRKPLYPEAHFNLARLQAKRGLSEEAIQEYRKAITQNANYPEAWLNMGVLYLQEGQLDSAEVFFRNAIKLRNRYPSAYFNLGLLLNRKGNSQPAVEAYRKALEIQPDYAEASANLGLIFKKMGKYQEALVIFQKQFDDDSTDLKAVLSLSECYQNLGRFSEGQALLKKALQMQPDWIEGRLALGYLLIGKKELKGARHEFEQSFKLSKKDLSVRLALAKLESQEGHLGEAVKHLRFILEQKPDHLRAREELQWLLRQGSDNNSQKLSQELLSDQKSLARLRQTLVKATSKQIDSLYQFWLAKKENVVGKQALLLIQEKQISDFLDNKNLKDAQEMVQQLIVSAPDIGLGYQSMIFALSGSDSLKSTMQKWFESMPEEENAWVIAASNWMKLKLYKETIRILEVAQQRFPQSDPIRKKMASAHFSLGVVQRKAGLSDSAYHSYSLAIQYDPSHYKAHLNLGILLEERKETVLALNHFKSSIQIKNDYANGFYHLANLQWGTSDSTEAKKNLLIAHKLDPKNKEVKKLAKIMGIRFDKKKKKG